MKAYPNIETRTGKGWNPLANPGKRIGYVASTGQAARIYGDSKHGYCVNGKTCRTLADVSAYLLTI